MKSFPPPAKKSVRDFFIVFAPRNIVPEMPQNCTRVRCFWISADTSHRAETAPLPMILVPVKGCDSLLRWYLPPGNIDNCSFRYENAQFYLFYFSSRTDIDRDCHSFRERFMW